MRLVDILLGTVLDGGRWASEHGTLFPLLSPGPPPRLQGDAAIAGGAGAALAYLLLCASCSKLNTRAQKRKLISSLCTTGLKVTLARPESIVGILLMRC